MAMYHTFPEDAERIERMGCNWKWESIARCREFLRSCGEFNSWNWWRLYFFLLATISTKTIAAILDVIGFEIQFFRGLSGRACLTPTFNCTRKDEQHRLSHRAKETLRKDF